MPIFYVYDNQLLPIANLHEYVDFKEKFHHHFNSVVKKCRNQGETPCGGQSCLTCLENSITDYFAPSTTNLVFYVDTCDRSLPFHNLTTTPFHHFSFMEVPIIHTVNTSAFDSLRENVDINDEFNLHDPLEILTALSPEKIILQKMTPAICDQFMALVNNIEVIHHFNLQQTPEFPSKRKSGLPYDDRLQYILANAILKIDQDDPLYSFLFSLKSDLYWLLQRYDKIQKFNWDDFTPPQERLLVNYLLIKLTIEYSKHPCPLLQQIIFNILMVLSVIGIIILIAKAIHSKATSGSVKLFFHQSYQQDTLEAVHKSLLDVYEMYKDQRDLRKSHDKKNKYSRTSFVKDDTKRDAPRMAWA